MKRMLIAALILLAPVAVMAQDEDRVQTSGSVTIGVQQVDVDGSNAQFNRFRDVRDGFYLYDLDLEGIDTRTGHFFDFRGQNLIRDDQEIRFGLGNFGLWRLDIERNEIPFRISDKAMTPFIYQGDGRFSAPSLVPIATQGTQSLVPTAPQMAVNDELVANWLETHLRHTELGTQRDRTSATLSVSPIDALRLSLSYMDERRTGNLITYGTIGDRPPRTLHIQMPQPVDYTTRELRVGADYAGNGYQAQLAYLLSDFENEIDRMFWQNIYFTPEPGENFAIETNANRRVASFGHRALAPDNRYHNVSGSFGIDLPMASRLTASAAYGWMKQDKILMPYSSLNFVETSLVNNPAQQSWNDAGRLPRQRADAEINTKLFNLDYTINPVQSLNLRAFFRYYDLDNKTGSDQWRYVSQDTVGETGGVNYRNFRSNLPYAYDKTNYGLDARYSLAFWRTTLGVGYEREEIDRDFREADTEENIVRASIRTRPTDMITARVSYLFGDREGKNYNSRITDLSYWYALGASPSLPGQDRDNPLFAFANHPDLRKFDVSDRERHQVDAAVTVTPLQALDVTASAGYRKDDFGSGVSPSQPLLNFPLDTITQDAREATTLGLQLGLLEEKRQYYTLDAYYAATNRLSFSAFGSHEKTESDIRGMVFNENRRENLNEIGAALTNLGRWDDPRYLYDLKVEDRTNTFGAGAGFEIVPGRVRISTDYILSLGKVDWDYRGYGTDIPPDPNTWETFQFGFRSPQTVKNNQYTLNATLEYQLVQNLIFGLHYLFDRYRMQDWMQEATGAWVEQVGSEFFLRDTSRDNRWGNRLVNMGTPLAGSYEAHVAYLTMTYRF
jgi:MtrB/PioB family decaheme-associated outer membrane protein